MNTITKPLELTPQTKSSFMGIHKNISAVKKLSGIIIIAVLFTIIFNSEALVIWAQKLPVNPITEVLFEMALEWHDLMNELGLTIVFDKLREAFRFFQSL
ncbi:hypothetical protein BGP_6209 [Beggiatoa sp. PS]|nr:hypothetical protein BGP_6209 [Beggiatoa sp. PS]